MIDKYINTVHHCDCLEFMQGLPDKCIDLVLTDPPYGIGENKGQNKSRSCIAISKDYGNKEWDNKIPDKIYFDEIFKISKNQIIFGMNFFIEYLKNTASIIVWDKDNGKNDFADCELIWTSFKTAVRKYKYTWHGMRQENMKDKEKRFHATQKPFRLLSQILEDYSRPNDIIFDPFAGSGTTAVSCIKTGRRYILCEKEKEYIDIIHKRIRKAKESVSLLELVE